MRKIYDSQGYEILHKRDKLERDWIYSRIFNQSRFCITLFECGHPSSDFLQLLSQESLC